jgi:AcrR family transcriptional regulator
MKRISPRKYPIQDRSRHTVDAIIQAAGQVLVTHGLAKSTTHVVAQRAGVSVGTLYQYFQNKESIFTELQRRYADELFENVGQMLGTFLSIPLKEAIPLFIKGYIAYILKNPDLWQALVEHRNQFLPEDERISRHQNLQSLLAKTFFQRKDSLQITDLELGAFVIINICESMTHSFLQEFPEYLRNGILEKELIALLSRYLLGKID